MNLFRNLYLELAELILSSDIFLGFAEPFTGPSKVAFKIPASAEDMLKVVLQPWLDGGVPFLVKVELRASLLVDMFLSKVVLKSWWLSVRLSLVLLKVVLALSKVRFPPSSFSNVVLRMFSS